MHPTSPVPVRFGIQRLLPSRAALPARLLYRAMGVADPAHWLHAAYFREALARHGPAAPRSILDAGCGRGDFTLYLAQAFPGAEVTGMDVDPALIERNRDTARQLNIANVRFITGDLSRLTESERYDFLVCIDVLEHIPRQAEALAGLAHALRAGGSGFLHIPTVRPKPVIFSHRLAAFHQWAEGEHLAEDLTAEQFCARVKATGLEILEQRATFGRLTGELATSLFALFFADTPVNRVAQGLVAPVCRLLAAADRLGWDRTRYAVGVTVRKPG